MTQSLQICIRKLERQMGSDARATQLLRLIDETDREVPYRSWLVLQQHVDLRLLIRPHCLAHTAISDARKLKGEAKASALIDAYGKTSEVLYQRYLSALWQLTCLAKGQWPKAQRFGNLVRQLHERLSDYPGLVDASARWMRNSARHEHWEPIPGEDEILMWDDHTPRMRVTIADLASKVNDMYQIAGVIFVCVAHRYLFRMLADTGTWSTFSRMIPCILQHAELDGSNSEVIEKQFEPELADIQTKFAPLIAFVQSTAPRAAAPTSS